jgi:hypothetical protein
MQTPSTLALAAALVMAGLGHAGAVPPGDKPIKHCHREKPTCVTKTRKCPTPCPTQRCGPCNPTYTVCTPGKLVCNDP